MRAAPTNLNCSRRCTAATAATTATAARASAWGRHSAGACNNDSIQVATRKLIKSSSEFAPEELNKWSDEDVRNHERPQLAEEFEHAICS